MLKAPITFLLVLVTLNLYSQEFGLKIGGGSANANIHDIEHRPVFRIHAGAFVSLPLSRHIQFSPEILYSGKGFITHDWGLLKGGTTKLDYLDFPLLFSFYGSPTFSLKAGPQIGILLNTSSDATNDPDYAKSFEKIDLSVVGGLIMNFEKYFSLEGRYVFGITKLADISFYDALGNQISGIQYGGNRVLQISLCYRIPFRKAISGTPKF